jgi:hypothetical protein
MEKFLKIFLFLLLILILIKIGLCAWRAYLGLEKPSLSYYLSIIEWWKELLKIAFLAFLAALITFFSRSAGNCPPHLSTRL